MNAASFWAGREDQARNGDPDYPDVSGGGVPYPPQPVSAREGAGGAGPSAPAYRPDQLLGARHDTPDQTGAVIDWEPLGAAPGQAAYEEPPLVYVRWCHVDDPEIADDELDGMWNGESPAEREFWRSLVPRELTAAAAAQAAPGEARDCGCPVTDGKIYHQRAACTDPAVAALDWYADGSAPGPETAAQPAPAAARQALEEAVEHAVHVTPAGSGTAAVMRAVDAYVYARAREAQPAPGPHYSTPDVECADCRAETELAEAIADRDDYAARLRDTDASWARVAAERDLLRELVDEVGVMAANAPEDDAFAVCEDIAMRIAAFGTVDEPRDGRHPDGCTCQFCREDEREERDREELDDDTDNTIPDTEGSDW